MSSPGGTGFSGGIDMTSMRLALAALMLLWTGPALAQGTASGHYDHDSVQVVLSHVTVLAQDNAEGLLDHPNQIRVVLSDQAVPVEALYGAIFPPVRAMAKQGEVHGVMFEFDPADRTRISITPLAKPDDPEASLATISQSNSQGLWRQLTVTATSITADYQDGDGGLTAMFSAPLASDPLTADLKGPAAQSSEQTRVLIARAEAMGHGDLTAAAALTARGASDDMKAMPPEELKAISQQVGEMIRHFKAVKRVVVRQHTAVALLGEGESESLVLEDGVWKVAD